jgi:TetR/AcrR family transcriptional regulator, regulator of autoinduction and epiphytic fitness
MSEKRTLKERKREAIIAAAIELFLQAGYQNTSMDAISAQAEVSKRTLYNHFSSKELLFQAIALQMFEQSAKAVATDYMAGESLESQLLAFANKELALFQSEQFRSLTKVMLAECIQSPDLTVKVMAKVSAQERGLEAWIEKAQADGRFRSVNAHYAASQFIGVIKANAFWPQVLMGQEMPDAAVQKQIAEDAVFMFLARYEVAG